MFNQLGPEALTLVISLPRRWRELVFGVGFATQGLLSVIQSVWRLQYEQFAGVND